MTETTKNAGEKLSVTSTKSEADLAPPAAAEETPVAEAQA